MKLLTTIVLTLAICVIIWLGICVIIWLGSIVLVNTFFPTPKTTMTWEVPKAFHFVYFKKILPDEKTCLATAEQDFGKICANTLGWDKIRCSNLWKSSNVSFDPQTKECILGYPVEGN